MENASRALLMAGSILIALLIISALIFMFNNLGEWKQTEATSEDIQKLAEYNRKIEKYNRAGLYGSEILSVANLVDDYNKTQSDLKGYTAIKLTVNITNQISGAKYMNKTSYTNYTELTKAYNNLKKAIDNFSKEKYGNGKDISYLAGLRTNDLTVFCNSYGLDQEEIETIIDEYNILKSEQKEFKTKLFGMPEIEYDNNTGRIKSMTYNDV